MSNNTINHTNFNFPNQKSVYRGKVREVYNIDDNLLIIFTFLIFIPINIKK